MLSQFLPYSIIHIHFTFFLDPRMVNNIRLSRLQHQCADLYKKNHTEILLKDPSRFLKEAYILERFKVILQAIPKTGRTTWQFSIWNNSLPTGSQLWKNVESASEIWHDAILKEYGITLFKNHYGERIRTDEYYRIVTVRHPFSRLESVYLNKLKDNPYYERRWGRIIAGKYRDKERKKKIFINPMTGKNVTFEEFIRFVIDCSDYDVHFKSYFHLAYPCHINYK